MDRNEVQQYGYDLARGMCKALAHHLLRGLLLITPLILISNYYYKHSNWRKDDSDAPTGQRSGLKVYTDFKTGRQYVSDQHGGLTPRLGQDDRPIAVAGSPPASPRPVAHP